VKSPNHEIAKSPNLSSFKLAAAFLLPAILIHEVDDACWRRAGRWLVPLGLLVGVGYALVFGAAWGLFGEYQYIRFVPAACVLTVDLAFGGYRLLMGGVRAVAGCSRHTGETPVPHHTDETPVPHTATPMSYPAVLALVLIVLLKYVLLLSLPKGLWQPGTSVQPLVPAWPPERFGFLFPPSIYRPLILMPLWGRWAMTLSLRIGRVAPDAPPRLQRMADGMPLWIVLAYSLACGVLTVVYCSPAARYAAQGVMIVMVVMLVAYLVSFVLTRRSRGQTEATLGAAGLSAELAFLMIYIMVVNRIYWY
jgi:hypothetical protein